VGRGPLFPSSPGRRFESYTASFSGSSGSSGGPVAGAVNHSTPSTQTEKLTGQTEGAERFGVVIEENDAARKKEPPIRPLEIDTLNHLPPDRKRRLRFPEEGGQIPGGRGPLPALSGLHVLQPSPGRFLGGDPRSF
jgi:hypothetical protein